MRSSLLAMAGLVALAAVAACAASGSNEGLTPPPIPDDDETVSPDTGAAEIDAGLEASVEESACSEAGWCVTSLPDRDLVMKDIWPLPGHTFAVAESPTLGTKVLEWNETAAKWAYIDDGTQNEYGLGKYVGKVWAPNENEVYYTVSPGYVYHGTRPMPPAVEWSWTRQRLRANHHVNDSDPYDGAPTYWVPKARYPALGVWGTSSSDVYAWFMNTIYHWTSVDGGAPEWVSEYVADDSDAPGERLFFLGAAGTNPDDVWFSGGRSREEAGCAVIVRKTLGSYQRIADGVLAGPYERCTERAGTPMIGGSEGWLTDIQPLAAGQFVALKGAIDVVKISVEGDSYWVALSPIQESSTRFVYSLWSTPDVLWLSGNGRVIRGTDVWDGGAYQISTISLSGGPLQRPMFQVRGASNTNLWAIGVHHALHKTTP